MISHPPLDLGLERRNHALRALRVRRPGGEPQVDLEDPGERRDCGIALLPNQVGDLLLDLGLPDAGQTQHAGEDRRRPVSRCASGEIGENRLLGHRLHLAGDARKRDDSAAVLGEDEPRRSTHGVGDHRSTTRHAALFEKAIEELDPPLVGKRSDSRYGRLVFDEVDPRYVGNCRRGDIVLRGPQSSCSENDIGPLHADAQSAGKSLDVITDRRLVIDVDSQPG